MYNNRDGGPYYDDSVGGHGYGINIGRSDGSLNNTLISNTVCGNDYLDIKVVTGVTGNTGDCNTCNTTANYNDTGTTGCTYSCGTLPLKFEKELVEDWNLVSLPLTPSDKQVISVLNSIDGKYDAVVRYNAATHQFMTLSESDEMDNGVGYFIHMTVNGTWSYQGTAYESINIGLLQGLNCIGWTNTSANLPGALNSIAGSYNYVARRNAASQSYEAYEPNAPPPFNDFTTMNRGEGYWIAAKGGCTLV